MTLARPLFLLALISLPVLWWLARRAAARRDHVVASLLLWRRIGLEAEPPRESRRRADLLLWLRMAAAALIAVGLAGPVIRDAAAPPTLHVLLDTSPSMGAFKKNAEHALARIEDHVSGGADVVTHETSDLEDLPAILATAGEGDVLVVTDHPPMGVTAGGRIRIVLVGEPVENVGFASAWVTEGERYVAVVTNFGTQARDVEVVCRGERFPVHLPAGESRTVEGDAPRAAVSLELEPGDRFAFDDRISAAIRRQVARRVTWRGPKERHTALALSIAGFVIGKGDEEVVYRAEADEKTKVLIAPPGRTRAVDGAIVTGPGMAPSAAPAPDAFLGPVVILEPGGDVLLSDRTGPLAVRRGRDRIEVAIDPGHGGSTWPADPSFPIFWAEATRLLARGADAGMPVGTTLDRGESSTRGESAPIDLEGLTPSPPPPPAERDFTRWLLLLGAVLIAVHTWRERTSTAY